MNNFFRIWDDVYVIYNTSRIRCAKKLLQISWTLLSNQAYFNSSGCLQFPQSLFQVIGNCIRSSNYITIMFYSLFSFLARSWYLSRFLYYHFFYSFERFYTSVSWLFLTKVWVIASILKSPGLFSVFWPISTIL